jgi:signal transduction histidine kinase
LINMRSRAESLDGEFVIDSEVGKQQWGLKFL